MFTTSSSTFPLLSLAVLLLLSGCVSNTMYPTQWSDGYPDLAFSSPKDEAICNLTGFYDDKGEAPPDQQEHAPMSLFGTLFPDSSSSLPDDSGVIDFFGPERDILRISFWSHGKLVSTHVLRSMRDGDGKMSPDRYICLKNGVVIVSAESEALALLHGLIATSRQISLFRGIDGRLILRQTETKMFLPWFLDVKGKWYRFNPVLNENGSNWHSQRH